MNTDRHYYYNQLEENDELFLDKAWLKNALKIIIEYNHYKRISDEHLNTIVNNTKYTKQDFLDIFSLKDAVIAEDLRILNNTN